MKKVLPRGVWSNIIEIDLTNLSAQSLLENLKKTLERVDLLKDKIVEIKGTSFSDPVVRNLSNVAARNLNETITGSWTFSSPITVHSINGPNNQNVLINARNYGVEIRIDEDSSGSDTFRITRGSGGSTTLMLVQNTGNVGIGTTSPTQRLDVSGNIRGTQFISTATTGTAPFQVNSTTKVNNLNADLLDGYDASTSSTANTVAVRDSSGNISANRFISTASTGTAPLQVSSSTLVTNLNADLLDGYHASTSATANTVAARDGSGNLSANAFVSTVSTGTAPLQVSSTTKVTNLNADLLDGYDSGDFARKAENATITGSWTFNNTIFAGNTSATIGTLTVNNNTTIKGDLTVEGGANAIAIKESSSDSTPGYLEKVSGVLRLTYTSTNPVIVYRGTTAGQADLEIFKDTGSGELPIYLRFHQGHRHWEAIKATNGLISFVSGNDTGFIDIQAKRVTATQDLVVAGNTIANSSGIPYGPLPALGNRNRDILVDRVAVWGDGMYPFALDLYRSDGWFTIPRTVYYGGQNIVGSIGARSGTTRVLRMYIVGVDNARNVYDPANQHWNNGRNTGVPWIRLIRGSNTWDGPLANSWGSSPHVKVYVAELPTSFLNGYFQVALGIWWDTNSPSWPTQNISGDTVPDNYQNYGVDIQWTIYQIWFEIYDRY